jgi:peptidoglycan L-alanyl-D-glutamate endopeptidase CwlK
MTLTKRTSSLDFLHPIVRSAAQNTIAELASEGIGFKIFESYRTPERQAFLRAKSPKVTNAGPWQSMHQYGLAVDLIIDTDGVNPWSTKGECRQWWDLMHESGRRYGLEPIRGELPHMQLPGSGTCTRQHSDSQRARLKCCPTTRKTCLSAALRLRTSLHRQDS